MVISFPARQVRRDAFCGGRASSPSDLGFRVQGSGFSLILPEYRLIADP
jgi:hypothetical protein